jgi:hypothetical protein
VRQPDDAAFDADLDARFVFGEFRHGEVEHDPARPLDGHVAADVLDGFAVAQLGEIEFAADARIDVGADHLARFGREQELPRDRRIEPRVEHARIGRVDRLLYFDAERVCFVVHARSVARSVRRFKQTRLRASH